MKGLVLILSCLAFVSCVENEKTANKQLDIVFGESLNVPFNLSQMIDSVYYVPLDNKRPVGRIDEIKYVDDTFFLIDKLNGEILRFNDKGQYLGAIKKRGHAKNEYVMLTDADVSPDGKEVSVYDWATQRIIRYTDTGVYQGSFEVKDVIRDFVVFSNGDYLCYTPDYQGEGIRRGLWKIDRNGKFKEQLVSIDDDFRFGGLFPCYLTVMDKDVFGLMAGEDHDKIYSIDQNGISDNYYLSFNISIPDKLKKDKLVDRNKNAGQIYEKTSYFETSRWMSFVTTDFKSILRCIYDKKNSKLYRITDEKDIIMDKEIYADIQFCFGDIGVSLLPSSSIKNREALCKKLPGLTAESNPVLCVTEFTK